MAVRIVSSRPTGKAPPHHLNAPTESLDARLVRVRACQLCAAHLPLGPRPVLQATTGARILMRRPGAGPRNNGWLQHHPWFEAELLPERRERVARVLA